MLLVRICLILAILASIGAGVIGFVHVKPAIEGLQQNLATETDTRKKAEADRDKNKKDLAATQETLQKEKEAHSGTRKERDQAKSDKESAVKQAATARKELADSQAKSAGLEQELAAWAATGVKPDQIKEIIEARKKAESEVAVLAKDKETLEREKRNLNLRLAALIDPNKDEESGPEMQGPIVGKVVLVDPKWDFVILNVGTKNNVLVKGVFLVNRDGKLVSKVRVRSVTEDTCIASVMSGWKLTEIAEGDQILY